MSTVVLLGAGASFGSGDVRPFPPPLGNQLFDALDALRGAAHRLPDDLKTTFRQRFEEGMIRFYEASGGRIMAFHQELACYLAQFSPGPQNAYLKLAEAVGSSNVAYVSLNYDLLLEESLVRLGKRIMYLRAVDDQTFEIVKPHGSCNFWPFLGNNLVIGGEAAQNAGGDVEAPVRPITQAETLNRCGRNIGFAPAIAMYAEGKDVRVCRDYISAHQARWRELVHAAERAFIIGVAVNPTDSHIWQPLRASGAELHYFGLPADEGHFWAWASGRANSHFHCADFNEAVPMIQAFF